MGRPDLCLLALVAIVAAMVPYAAAQSPTETTGDYKAVPPVTPEAPGIRPGERHRPLTFRVAQQVLPLFNALETGEGYKGELAIIGDSVSFGSDQYVWYLKQHFVDEYGSGGVGFLSPSAMNGNCDGPAYIPCGITLGNTQGSSRGTNSRERDERYYGLDVDGNIGWVSVSESGFHGRLFGDFMGDEVTIHYIKEFGAGTFQIVVNGSSVAVLNAFTEGAPKHAEYTVQTGAGSPTELNSVQVRHVSGGEVLIDGFEMSYGSSGFVFHRLSRGGAGPDDFIHGIGDATEGFLAALAPQLTIVMLDWVGVSGHMTYRDDMHQLLSFYEQSMPDTRFILVTHYAFNDTIEDEADALYEIARERGHGYINLYDLFSGFNELNSLGLLIDEVHLSAIGGAWFGEYIYDVLTQAAVDARTADFSGDENIGLEDLLGFIAGIGEQNPACDLNADGLVDYTDVLRYINAYRSCMR